MKKLYDLLTSFWAPRRRSKTNLEDNDGEGQVLAGEDLEVWGDDGMGEREEEDDSKHHNENNESKQDEEIPATQPDPSSPLPPRTPQKVTKDGYECGERFCTHLAWTLGGELPPTLELRSPWEVSPPRANKPVDEDDKDELDKATAELQRLEFLDCKHI